MEILHHVLGRDPLYKIRNSSDKNFILFTFSEGGSFVFQDKLFPMKKGSLFFIRSKTYHYTAPDNVEEYDRSKIYLSDKYFEKLVSLASCDIEFAKIFSQQMAYAIVPNQMICKVEDIFNRASLLSNNDKAEFINCFFELLTIIKKHSCSRYEGTLAPSSKDCVSLAIEYITKNYHLPITLNEVCKKVLTSKYHFCRKFKSAVGMTVMDFLFYTRIEMAKNFLAKNNLTISEICEKCGFSSISYFCQKFKTITGKTATQYSKQFNF